MRAEFYEYKGLDENGVPKPETLKKYGLENLRQRTIPYLGRWIKEDMNGSKSYSGKP